MAHVGAYMLAVLLEPKHVAVEADLYARQGLRVSAHYFFDRVLGNPLRVLGVQRILARRTVHRVFESRQLVAREPRDKYDVRGVVDAERRAGPQLVGNAPTAHVLARAHVGGLGARRVAHARIALDHEARHTTLPELDGQRQPEGPAPTIKTRFSMGLG